MKIVNCQALFFNRHGAAFCLGQLKSMGWCDPCFGEHVGKVVITKDLVQFDLTTSNSLLDPNTKHVQVAHLAKTLP